MVGRQDSRERERLGDGCRQLRSHRAQQILFDRGGVKQGDDAVVLGYALFRQAQRVRFSRCAAVQPTDTPSDPARSRNASSAGKACSSGRPNLAWKDGQVHFAKIKRHRDEFAHRGRKGEVVEILDGQLPVSDLAPVSIQAFVSGAAVIGQGLRREALRPQSQTQVWGTRPHPPGQIIAGAGVACQAAEGVFAGMAVKTGRQQQLPTRSAPGA